MILNHKVNKIYILKIIEKFRLYVLSKKCRVWHANQLYSFDFDNTHNFQKLALQYLKLCFKPLYMVNINIGSNGNKNDGNEKLDRKKLPHA